MTASLSERWKVITGFSCYEVSTHGRIKMLKNPPHRGKQGVRIQAGDLIPLKKVGNYLGCVLWSDAGNPKLITIHRLVALAFLKTPPLGKPLVRHLNGDGKYNFYKNLEWGDDFDNAVDSIRHGNNKHHTFTEDEVQLLRNEFSDRRLAGEKTIKMKMSKEYGVNYWTLRDMLNKKRYRWAT